MQQFLVSLTWRCGGVGGVIVFVCCSSFSFTSSLFGTVSIGEVKRFYRPGLFTIIINNKNKNNNNNNNSELNLLLLYCDFVTLVHEHFTELLP